MLKPRNVVLILFCLGLVTLLSCFTTRSSLRTGTIRSSYIQTKAGTKKIIFRGDRVLVNPKAENYGDRYDIKQYHVFTDDSGVNHKYNSFSEAKQAILLLYGEPDVGGGEGCFTADTLVLTEKGAKRIAEIEVGDSILTYGSDGKITTNQVAKALEFENDHYYLINNQIKVTRMHRFFTSDGWKRVHRLAIGDKLRKSDGSFETISSMELVHGKLPVFSLEIHNDHNFFVSSDGRDGFLVHNHGAGGK